jgi:predicted lysophospholipase L1 biosynthesis ABC-type transport system permease subunit
LTGCAHGTLGANQGSLYLAFQRLEKTGRIAAEWRTTDNNRRAKYYRLTSKGRRALDDEVASWRRYAAAVEWILDATLRTTMHAELAPLHRFLVGDSRLPLLVLLGSVLLLLLVACANVGNLLLVRAAARERETALRVAIGASGSRLVRQSLVDSLVLACFGGVVGLALDWWATRTLAAMMPAGMLPVHELAMRWSIVWLVLAVTTVSGVAFGVVPAAWASRRDPSDALKAGGRGSEGDARANRWGRRLAVMRRPGTTRRRRAGVVDSRRAAGAR